MSSKPTYVVILYKNSQAFEGAYGPFKDLEAAKVFARCSNARRCRIAEIRNPQKFLFDAETQPGQGGRDAQ